METSSNFLQNLDELTLAKKRKKMLEKQKYCKTTLLIESDVETKHFPYSMSEYIPKTEQKTSESGIYYEFFFLCKQKYRVSVTMATASELLIRLTYASLLKNLFSQRNEAFFQSY
jgi:hypothetical protein